MRKLSILLSILLTLSLLSGCGKEVGETSVQSVSMICGMGGVGMVNRFSGMTTSMGETKVQKSDSLTISSIKVEVGDKVKEGDELFTYDTAQTKLDLERAKLDLELQQNTLDDQKKQKEELEKEKNEATLDQQLSYSLEIRQMEANIQETSYNMKLKQQEITKLSNQVSNSSVKSPITGTIKSINENNSYDDYGNLLPFMTIVETDGFRIMGYINEANMSSLYLEQRVIIRSRISNETWGGSVSSIDWDNPSQNQNYYGDSTNTSSKYPFYVTLDSSENLMLGQHVYIEPDNGQDTTASEENLIYLPSYFIVDADSSPYVWAQDKNGKLEKRSLTLGAYDADMDTYVVESGLTAKDYIAYPDDTLTVGMKCVTYDEANFSSSTTGMVTSGDTYYDPSIGATIVGGSNADIQVSEGVMLG